MKPKISRRKEIIKIRVESNEIENEQIQKSFLGKVSKSDEHPNRTD